MKNIDKIHLASKSKFRLALCNSAGIPVNGLESYCKEELIVSDIPKELARLRSEAKGSEIGTLDYDALVISSDQVLEFEGKAYGKAETEKEALERLMMFSGKTHYLHSAYSIYYVRKSEKPQLLSSRLVSVEMKMRDFSETVARNYISSGEWKGCAGCYQFENKGAHLFESAKGESSAIIGLPILDLLSEFRGLGIDFMEKIEGPWKLN